LLFWAGELLAETHLASRAVIGEPENRRSDSPPWRWTRRSYWSCSPRT